MGKLITINGKKFFTEDNPNLDEENMRVTDGETGAFVGYISNIKNNWDKYLEQAQVYMKKYNYNNVLELPITVEGEIK